MKGLGDDRTIAENGERRAKGKVKESLGNRGHEGRGEGGTEQENPIFSVTFDLYFSHVISLAQGK